MAPRTSQQHTGQKRTEMTIPHAMKGDEANQWRNAARTEMQNFERHGVYIEISEDRLPSWNNHSKQAAEAMMWVLRKKKHEKGDLLKYKARAVVCGNQQSLDAQLTSESDSSTWRPRTCKANSKGTMEKSSFDHRPTSASLTIAESRLYGTC
eukprot:6195349-Pleurochrysis_carterae.AAC.1